MRIIQLKESLRLTGSEYHGWNLQRRVGPLEDRLWVGFRYFSTLEAARAKLGDLPESVDSGPEGLQDLRVEGFMPDTHRGIQGFMRTINSTKDRQRPDPASGNFLWKPANGVRPGTGA